MDVLELIATIAALAGLILPLTQLLKVQLGLKGRVVLVLSLLLGALTGGVLAAGGVAGLAVLSTFPKWVSGAVLGLLAGATASGGKDTITGIQINGAQARAKAQAEYSCPADTPAAPAPPATPADEWAPATLDDLARTRTNWPAPSGLDEPPPLDRGH